MSVELQEAEGRVKAARTAETETAARSEAAIAVAREAAVNATKAREQAEADYEAIYDRHAAALASMRDRVFNPPTEPEPAYVEATANAA